MSADSVTAGDIAIYLGIYASVASTGRRPRGLYVGLFRERARITVRAPARLRTRTDQSGLAAELGEGG